MLGEQLDEAFLFAQHGVGATGGRQQQVGVVDDQKNGLGCALQLGQ